MTTTTQQHVSRHKPPVGVTPLAMRTVQAAFASLGNVAPHLTARMAEKLYFTPRRFKRPEREREYLARAHRFHVSTPRSDVAAYAWGPELFPWEARAAHNTVLLMHGWEGRGTQLGAFIDPLVASGFQVVALDAPAHGRSPGEQTDLLQFKDAIRAVARHVGGVHAVVAHSMGGPSTVMAMAEGLTVERAVIIGAPNALTDVMSRFSGFMHLTASTEKRLRLLVEERLGPGLWEKLDLEAMLTTVQAEALIIHDEQDDEVPYNDAVRNARAWEGSTLMTTQGLGHRRILRDDAVINAVVEFVRGGPSA